jgi:putative ABC transport system permease protein
MVVAALSADYVTTVQLEITGLYGNNIGVITPKAILQTRQRFQSGNSAFTVAIAFIALLVGAVGIITTLYTVSNIRIHWLYEIGQSYWSILVRDILFTIAPLGLLASA